MTETEQNTESMTSLGFREAQKDVSKHVGVKRNY